MSIRLNAFPKTQSDYIENTKSLLTCKQKHKVIKARQEEPIHKLQKTQVSDKISMQRQADQSSRKCVAGHLLYLIC